MALNFGRSIFTGDRERTIASFDFLDIARNIAYEILYPGQTFNTTSNEYRLSGNKFYSGRVDTTGTTTASTATRVINVSFDTETNQPIVIDGTVIMNIPMMCLGAAGSVTEFYIVGKVVKVTTDTGIEYEDILGNKQSNFITVNGVTEYYSIASIQIIVPLTKFRKGDKLRMKVEGWLRDTASAGTVTGRIAHDPMSRNRSQTTDFDWGTNETEASILVPIKIDL